MAATLALANGGHALHHLGPPTALPVFHCLLSSLLCPQGEAELVHPSWGLTIRKMSTQQNVSPRKNDEQ
jgi:hypothetical protein